jgi:hypothetical protein
VRLRTLVLAGVAAAQGGAYPTPDSALRASLEPLVPLEQGFADPPLLARTRCWWWWLNGNTTKAAITRDLEEMKAKGFGGANVIDAGGADQRGNEQVPHGPDFASPDWRELFLHALAEADRLELELGFNIVSGWNLGGPMVTPEQAAKRLTWSETVVAGDQQVERDLPLPEHRDGFYRDVAVVALPIHDLVATKDIAITASSQQEGRPVQQALDGDAETFWVSAGKDAGQGPREGHPEWVELAFAEPVEVDRIEILPRPGYGPRRGHVATRRGEQEHLLGSFTQETDDRTVLRFARTRLDRLRVTILGSFDPRHPDAPRNVQIAELAVFDGERRLSGSRRPGGIRHFEQKAYYRYPGGFTAAPAWHLLETDPERAEDVACRSTEVVDLAEHITSPGHLSWRAPHGTWRVLRFGYTITGAEVSTHSEGWAGLAIDYLDSECFEAYWQAVMEPILAEARPYLGRSLRYLHTDSWELGPVNWTAAMPAAFRESRGYALTPYLPVLADHVVDSRERSTRFLNDFRRVLADRIAEHKYATFDEHAARFGLGIHPESGGPHAAPFDALRNLGIGDIPMGEFWARSTTHRVADTQRLFVKQTSSAASTYGRRIAMAEAFTTIGPHWQRDPRMLKPTFDRAACEGHNLTMWHTFDSSPAEMGIPGQVYFAGTHLNPNVTWWPQADAFIGYLNRCQFLLQQGVMVTDVLHFYGENIPAFVRLKRDDPAGTLPGYDYDVIDAKALRERVRVADDGALVLPEGKRYRLLSLTPHDAIDLGMLRTIAGLVEQGATLVGRRPQRRFGLGGGDAADEEFEALCESLWGDAGRNARRRGRVIEGRSAREVLVADGVPPDFGYTSTDEGAFLDYVHRRTDTADLYFVVNREDAPVRADARFRVSGRRPELWDPVSGQRRPATRFRLEGDVTVVPLELGREQSLFVVFQEPPGPGDTGEGPGNFPALEEVAVVEGRWTLAFDRAWGGPPPFETRELFDWSQRDEPAIRHYSGAVDYTIEFEWDPRGEALAGEIHLDLGELRNLAEVRLNGVDLGIVWCRPFRVRASEALHSGTNCLQVRVVNLWANRVIGDAGLPPDQRLTRTNVRALGPDTPLEPSGLLGPVRLLRERP